MRKSIAHPYVPQNVTENGHFTHDHLYTGLVFKDSNGVIVNNNNTYSLVSCSQCLDSNLNTAKSINPKLKDNKGLTPLHYLSYHERCEEMQKKPDLAKALIDEGADINALYIIEKGAFFSSTANENHPLLVSPLYLALTNQPLVAKLLLERGADIHQLAFYLENGHYKPINPLEYAIKIGNKELVNHCLQNYFNIYEPFRDGVTALSYAQKQYIQEQGKELTYFRNHNQLQERKEILDTIKMASESHYYSFRYALNICKFYLLEHKSAVLAVAAIAGLVVAPIAGLVLYRTCASISINSDIITKMLSSSNEATIQI